MNKKGFSYIEFVAIVGILLLQPVRQSIKPSTIITELIFRLIIL